MAVISRDSDVFPADLAGCSPPSATTPGKRLGPVATRLEIGGPAMRPIAVLLGVLLLVVAGCSGDDAPAEPAATTTQVSAITQPAVDPTISPLSAEEAVDATVVFEPGSCTYLGPVVIPYGTKVAFEFDDGGHAVDFVVGLVIDGTTREEIIEYNETRGGPNTAWVSTPYFSAGPAYRQRNEGFLEEGSTGSGEHVMVVEFRDDGDWAVECITSPYLTNRAYLGGMIKVIEG